MVRASAIFATNSQKLNEIELRYTDVLSGIAAAVRRQSDSSTEQTAKTIAQGRTAILALIGFAIILAGLAALAISHAVSRPAERLTAHLRRVRKDGELTQIEDPALMASTDELGELARAFNAMIAQLREARSELIDKSEAEISRQVERLQAAITNMPQGLCMFDADFRLIISNDRFAEIYGIEPARIKPGITLQEILQLRLMSGGYYGEAKTYVDHRLQAERRDTRSTYILELHNGKVLQIVREPLKNGGWVATHEDITERRKIEAKIAHMAHHDDLTNLPNRMTFR